MVNLKAPLYYLVLTYNTGHQYFYIRYWFLLLNTIFALSQTEILMQPSVGLDSLFIKYALI